MLTLAPAPPTSPIAGSLVTVALDDGYAVTGRFMGLTRDHRSDPMLRILAADGLEYRLPVDGATVRRDG